MIDGCGPLPVERPADAAEAGEIVRRQRARHEAVYPVGGGTMLDFGLPPAKAGVALATDAWNRIIDHPARDLTITVQAGVTLRQLQAALAEQRQWLPIDMPDPSRITIGGAIAANLSGPRRLGYGTLRDYILGISFISDDGEEISGGGRVVKNVAGYDLMKLHIGALGTMGIITQVTLKVRPRPEAQALVRLRCPADRFAALCDLLHAGSSRPAGMGFQRGDAIEAFVLFEEKAETVAWQLSTLKEELAHAGFETGETLTDGIDDWIQRHAALQLDPGSRFIAKLAFRPSEIGRVIAQYPECRMTGEPLTGTAWLRADDPIDVTEPGTVVRRAPADWKTPDRIFGQSAPAFELMRHVQRTLDPDAVFNPGRLFAISSPLP